jgi:hypothetical protein
MTVEPRSSLRLADNAETSGQFGEPGGLARKKPEGINPSIDLIRILPYEDDLPA